MTLEKDNPKWKKQDLTPPFVYNCDDPTLEIDVIKVRI